MLSYSIFTHQWDMLGYIVIAFVLLLVVMYLFER
jgi:hypothetical protein